MRILIMILSVTLLSSPESCHATTLITADHLKVNSNGTATVTGIVLENNNGCATDAACYLRIQVGNREVHVIYNPGESTDRVNNHEATDIAGKVKEDAHVEVYGKYSRQRALDVIEIYSSKQFYIHVLD